MSWHVTYINREGVREAYRGALPMPFNERSAKYFAGVLNGMSDFALASYGPQAVGTFRAEEDKPAPAPLTFTQGYVCAVANLLRDHGETTMAADLLRGAGRVNWSEIDPYDRDEIARHGLLPKGTP